MLASPLHMDYHPSMDIKNVSEFAGFCQENAGDESFSDAVVFAERLADLSVALSRQYGGRGTTMSTFIDVAFMRLQKEAATEPAVQGAVVINETTLEKADELLTRFWEHSEAIDAWFSSKVIVVPTQPGS